MWLVPKTGSHNIIQNVDRGGNNLKHSLVSMNTNRLFVNDYQPNIYYRYTYSFNVAIEPLEPYTTNFFSWDTDTYLLEGNQRLSFFGNTNELNFKYRQMFIITQPLLAIPAKTTIIGNLNFRYHFVDNYGLQNTIVELIGEEYQTALYPNTIEIDLHTIQYVLPSHKVIKVETTQKNIDAVVWRNMVFSKTNTRFPKDKTFTQHSNHIFLWQIL